MIHQNELYDPDVLGGHEEHALLRGAPWRRLAVLGDSVAEGVGDEVWGYASLPWAMRLARGLRSHHPDLAYLNLGRRDLRAHEVRATQLGPALAFEPDLAAVVAGGNDLLGRRFDPDAVERELDVVVDALRGAGADVLMFTLLDVASATAIPDPWATRLRERTGELSALTVDVARRHGALLVDCASHPRGSDPSSYSADLLHANMRGHAVVAGAAIRELSRVLTEPVAA